MVFLLWLIAVLSLLISVATGVVALAGGILGIGIAVPAGVSGILAFALIGGLAEVLRALRQIRDQSAMSDAEKVVVRDRQLKQARAAQTAILVGLGTFVVIGVIVLVWR